MVTTVRAPSVLNDVLGPVMRGPSSSHTAGSFHIARIARDLLGAKVTSATVQFDPAGSLAEVYEQQGSDLAFAAGLLDLAMTDDDFTSALRLAAERGLDLSFQTSPLPEADHPNSVEIRLEAEGGTRLQVLAKSVGGGAIVIDRLDGWPVQLTGDAYDILVLLESEVVGDARRLLVRDGRMLGEPSVKARDQQALLHVRWGEPVDEDLRKTVESLAGVSRVYTAVPVFHVLRGASLFSSAAGLVSLSEERGLSLGEAALAYESTLLGFPEDEVLAEVGHRLDVMQASVKRGLRSDLPPMRLLAPSAGDIYEAEADGRLAAGGTHTRAAARAMAVMHVNGGMGVVCAAPTAGSAGVIPGTVVTMMEEWGIERHQAALALLASAAIGLVVATRATFAAEVAGCQVEIGVAGGMAAAAVVDAFGGTAQQGADAAAIVLQNSMGSICDMVQGVVEIPCHTRNAVAASAAFVCADLILGGYTNPIPLDETIDAVYATGRMLPRELKCTALGGLAATPSAKRLRPRR